MQGVTHQYAWGYTLVVYNAGDNSFERERERFICLGSISLYKIYFHESKGLQCLMLFKIYSAPLHSKLLLNKKLKIDTMKLVWGGFSCEPSSTMYELFLIYSWVGCLKMKISSIICSRIYIKSKKGYLWKPHFGCLA